ncbi:hypothetical protein MS3_00006000 [Schistosoma haematobium]|uniref:Uncharacterized protein n=1 Tax=Schistosoma haematobium TaxID=6185 RepID=A0A094ZMU8_SCHHA|nr:hypothetical protein MS3_00006000 [Schistosoma haematobium]KAH9584366.1 hypothetical protein MS3_00006000 [Schistosoma haematobium]
MSVDQLKIILQQTKFQAPQLKTTEMMGQKSIQENSIQISELTGSTTESQINSMSEFHFDPEANVTLGLWTKMYGNVCQKVLVVFIYCQSLTTNAYSDSTYSFSRVTASSKPG